MLALTLVEAAWKAVAVEYDFGFGVHFVCGIFGWIKNVIYVANTATYNLSVWKFN